MMETWASRSHSVRGVLLLIPKQPVFSRYALSADGTSAFPAIVDGLFRTPNANFLLWTTSRLRLTVADRLASILPVSD